MKRLLLFTLFSLFAMYSNAHTEEPDPLSFFPHHVGDTWAYLYYQSDIENTSITDVQAEGNNIYVYHNNYPDPAYRIDENFNVFFHPETFPYFLEYKLTAKKGDMWKVAKYSSTSLVAVVQDVFQSYIFDKSSIVMEIAYFEVPDPDTTVTEDSPYRYTYFLASGFGFIRHIGEAGDVWVDLVGCIIDGDTLGIVTGVGEEGINTSSVHIFPNPCSSFTTVHFSLPAGTITHYIEIIDIFGRILHSADIQTDSYTLDTSTLSNGIYFCRVTAGTHTAMQKIIVRG